MFIDCRTFYFFTLFAFRKMDCFNINGNRRYTICYKLFYNIKKNISLAPLAGHKVKNLSINNSKLTAENALASKAEIIILEGKSLTGQDYNGCINLN